MYLTFIGHAGWSIQSADRSTSIVCDPWLNPEGAYYASWFPFPDNSEVELPEKVDAIYVSHAHHDHLDIATLNRFPKDTPFIIADFQDPALEHALRQAGFSNLRKLAAGEKAECGGLELEILVDEDGSLYHDSALSVREGGTHILNLNDCHVSEDLLAEVGQTDVLMVQYSNAAWYPCVYEYPSERKAELSREKRNRGLERMRRYADICDAKVTLPCAGPPAFLDPELRHWNDLSRDVSNPFVQSDVAVEFLREHERDAELAMPGDVFEVPGPGLKLVSREIEPDEVYGDNLTSYLERYAAKRADDIRAHRARIGERTRAEDAPALFVERMEAAIRTSEVFAPQIGISAVFELTGPGAGTWIVDFADRERPVREYQPGETAEYFFKIDSLLIADLLSREEVNFENLLLSLRLSARRDPDYYNPNLFGLLINFDEHRLKIAEQTWVIDHSTDETFVLEHGNCRYEVGRRCPHMGSDLELVGKAENGVLTCTRHGWKFRLEDGVCLNVPDKKIRVKKLS